jgi:hypothetical protein
MPIKIRSKEHLTSTTQPPSNKTIMGVGISLVIALVLTVILGITYWWIIKNDETVDKEGGTLGNVVFGSLLVLSLIDVILVFSTIGFGIQYGSAMSDYNATLAKNSSTGPSGP